MMLPVNYNSVTPIFLQIDIKAPGFLEDCIGVDFNICDKTSKGGKMEMVFPGTISYSHSKPGRLAIYVTGTRLRNHANMIMWDSGTAHAVKVRQDALQLEEANASEEAASDRQLANILKNHVFADEPPADRFKRKR